MGKAARNRQQSVRERIAAQQAAARRAEARRRLLIAGGGIVVVLAIVLVFVVIKLNSGSSDSSGTSGSSSSVTGTALPASVNRDVTGVPVSTLDTIGEGSVLSCNPCRSPRSPTRR